MHQILKAKKVEKRETEIEQRNTTVPMDKGTDYHWSYFRELFQLSLEITKAHISVDNQTSYFTQIHISLPIS